MVSFPSLGSAIPHPPPRLALEGVFAFSQVMGEGSRLDPEAPNPALTLLPEAQSSQKTQMKGKLGEGSRLGETTLVAGPLAGVRLQDTEEIY